MNVVEVPGEDVRRVAFMSADRVYRYALWVRWGAGPYAMVIGLNPSTADEANDDPTLRRCIRFARDWGFGALCMANLFAYRATEPQDMLQVTEPVGPENIRTLRALFRTAGVVVAAWGTHGKHRRWGSAVRGMLSADGVALHCLRLTKDGHPAHPLYLPAALRPVPWTD